MIKDRVPEHCRAWAAEAVECARRRNEPGGELRKHLAVCAGCRERWEAEVQLSAQLRVMQLGAEALGARHLAARNARRDALMTRFSATHRRSALPSWGWALGAAAALVMAVFTGNTIGRWTKHSAVPAIRTHGVRTGQAVFYEVSADASALTSDDFVAVPYTPPLAPGEMVRMMQAEMSPEALAGMGVEVDPAWTEDVAVDLVVGEDGLPRAVRLAENSPAGSDEYQLQ